ncbi:MAG: hypothetical protein ACHQUC_06110 [Chlamydiales bacterium]
MLGPGRRLLGAAATYIETAASIGKTPLLGSIQGVEDLTHFPLMSRGYKTVSREKLVFPKQMDAPPKSLDQRKIGKLKTGISHHRSFKFEDTRIPSLRWQPNLVLASVPRIPLEMFSDDGGHLSIEDINQFHDHTINRVVENDHISPDQKRDLDASLTSSLNNTKPYIASKFGKDVPLRGEAPYEKTDLLFSSKEPDEIFAQSQKFVEQSKKFNSTINKILSKDTREEQAKNLEHFLFHGARRSNGRTLQGIDRFNSSELKVIFMKFWDINGYDYMAKMMFHCNNTYFTKNPINLEFFAKALLKGHYFNLEMAQNIANLLLEDPESKVQGMAILGVIHTISKNAASQLYAELNRGEVNPDTVKFYLKCFPGSSHHPDEVSRNYQLAIDRSIQSYAVAFNETTDCRYSCRIMHRFVEQGLTEDKSEEIQKYAELTRLAALKEGGLKSNNLSVVRAYLEALYLLPSANPEEIKLAEKVLLSLCQNDSQVHNVLSSLKDLKVDSAHKSEFELKLEDHLNELEGNPKVAQEKLAGLRSEINQSIDEWELYTYNHKGVNSNFITGNFSFGAQLPTQNINRYDRKFFGEVLTAPISLLLPESKESRSLADIETFDEFDQLADRIIRSNFHTDEWDLERLDSEGHKQFDDTIQGLITMSGATTPEARKQLPDSRTNISSNFILGLGDCRHQTQAKQILFDLWHAQKLDGFIREINLARSQGDQTRVEELQQQFAQLNAQQFHTFDCEIHLPVQMEDNHPVWHEGHMVLNETGTVTKVEEHTLNVQLNYDPKTDELQEVILHDTFYQNTYPWKEMAIDPHASRLGTGTPAGSIELYNPRTKQLETHVIHIKPTRYAGTRDIYNRGSNSNRFVGQAVEPLTLEEALARKDEIERNNAKARDWYRSR